MDRLLWISTIGATMTDLLQQKWFAKRDPSHFHTLSTVESSDGRLIIHVGGDVTPEEQAKVSALIEAAPDLLRELDYLLETSPEKNSGWWYDDERQRLEEIARLVDDLQLLMEE